MQGHTALQRAVDGKYEEVVTLLLKDVYDDDMNQAMLAEQVKHQLWRFLGAVCSLVDMGLHVRHGLYAASGLSILLNCVTSKRFLRNETTVFAAQLSSHYVLVRVGAFICFNTFSSTWPTFTCHFITNLGDVARPWGRPQQQPIW